MMWYGMVWHNSTYYGIAVWLFLFNAIEAVWYGTVSVWWYNSMVWYTVFGFQIAATRKLLRFLIKAQNEPDYYRGICRTASPKLCLPPPKNLSLAKIIAPPLDRISNNLEKLLTCPPSDLSLAKIIAPLRGGSSADSPVFETRIEPDCYYSKPRFMANNFKGG
jgi:hypothetical protein